MFYPIYKGKMAKISPKIHKIEIWPKSRPKVIILIWTLDVPFFWSQRLALLAKVTDFGPQKMALPVAKSKF